MLARAQYQSRFNLDGGIQHNRSTLKAVDLVPRPSRSSSLNWTGPNKYTSTSRQINSIPLTVGSESSVATCIKSCYLRMLIVAAPSASCEKTCDQSIKPRNTPCLKVFSGTTIVSPG